MSKCLFGRKRMQVNNIIYIHMCVCRLLRYIHIDYYTQIIIYVYIYIYIYYIYSLYIEISYIYIYIYIYRERDRERDVHLKTK